MRVAHMIAKEHSWFSAKLMSSSIISVAPAIDKIIIVDNGCSDLCREMYEATLKQIGDDYGVEHHLVIDEQEKDFDKLRNICIEHGSVGDLCIKLDADDVHYHKGVKEVFDYMSKTDYTVVVAQFYHHRRDPFQYQDLHRKDIFFRQLEGTKWDKPVHESLNVGGGLMIDCDYKYHHFGYCKSRSELLYHWINYDILEFGRVERYDVSSVEAVDPNKDLHGQFDPSENKKYEGPFPNEVAWMFDDTMQSRGLYWDETGLVGSDFDPLGEFIDAYREKTRAEKA